MFKALWRAIISLFECSKEERWERLDRLAETNPQKYRDEIATLSMKELNSYMDSELYPLPSGEAARQKREEVMQHTYVDHASPTGDTTAVSVVRVVDEVVVVDKVYHWKPGQEHLEPAKQPVRKKNRPGVFDRPAMNRRDRRKADAAARRQRNAGKDAV